MNLHESVNPFRRKLIHEDKRVQDFGLRFKAPRAQKTRDRRRTAVSVRGLERVRERVPEPRQIDPPKIEENSTDKIFQDSQVALLHSKKMEAIGQLAAGMAHEINTPLQYIGGNLEFMAEAFDELSQVIAVLMNKLDQVGLENNPLADRKDKIEFILARLPKAVSQSKEGVANVGRIVQGMRGFSHPADTPVEADINDSIETALRVSKGEWRFIADIELHLDRDLPKKMCLPAELNQGFLNMIVNAAHAVEEKLGPGSYEKGLISISTSFDSNDIFVKISDTGMGIAGSLLNRIYDQFFTTKEVGKGTGQGLSICHAIFVEKYGGKIDVESELGEGTTFTISLPQNGLPGEDAATRC